MLFNTKVFILFVHLLILSCLSEAKIHHPKFVIKDAPFTKLCSTKNILTVNGKFPGPTIYAERGDTLMIDIVNQAKENITIHWHGAKQLRYPWSDGPEYITQCPIRPGTKFSQKIVLSDEIGTLWWHAHSDWSRATVVGALIIYPNKGTTYPFPKPQQEVPIILGEWWKSDIQTVEDDFLESGGDPVISDAYLINGQPGDLISFTCSQPDTFKMKVDHGKTYLLRVINGVMNNILFFSVANHSLTLVGSDGAYTKPLKSEYVAISPGQTMDILLEANQQPSRYYMAARAYNGAIQAPFDNTTTTAIVEYNSNYTNSSPPPQLPVLPAFNDTNASASYTGKLRSLASVEHPIEVPLNISTKLLYTISINTLPCEQNNTCEGPGGNRFAATVNNQSFVNPRIDILQAYYHRISGVYGDDFPDIPPLPFNYTSNLTLTNSRPNRGTELNVLEYNSTVELVFQNTNFVASVDHPMHLHGYSFYVVGWGFGNFDSEKDPLNYNLVDPPLQNTIAVPKNGWTAIRFKANNPGVWLMHCHFERHVSWGMSTVFIVKNGKRPEEKMMPPPPNMPQCPT